jgi:hypothetical protein
MKFGLFRVMIYGFRQAIGELKYVIVPTQKGHSGKKKMRIKKVIPTGPYQGDSDRSRIFVFSSICQLRSMKYHVSACIMYGNLLQACKCLFFFLMLSAL